MQREAELGQTESELVQGGTLLDTEATSAWERCKTLETRSSGLETLCVGLAPACVTTAQCIAEPDQRLRGPR